MVVLDCSAAIHMACRSDEGKMFKSLMLKGETVISSKLLYPEASNVLWKYARAGLVDARTAIGKAATVIALVDEFYDVEPYYEEALSDAVRLKHPAYDLFYLLLAKRMGATLFTADKRLTELAEREGVDCIHEVTV